MLRLSMVLLVALHCAGMTTHAYPAKPMRVFIPASPGDSCDVRNDFERSGKLARDLGFEPR